MITNEITRDMGLRRQLVRSVLPLIFMLYALVVGAQQRTVGPDGPDDPALKRTVTITVVNPEGGTVSPMGTGGKVSVIVTDDLSLTITPKRGWRVEGVSLDGTSVSSFPAEGGVYKLEKVSVDHKVEVTFAQSVFKITTEVNPEGTATVSPSSAEVEMDQNFIFTVRTSEGYVVKSVTASSGSTLERTQIEGQYILKIVKEDEKITVVTESPASYTVALSVVEGGKLSITPQADKYAYGTILTVAATAETGYETERITVNGIPLYGSTFRVTGDMTVAATFKKASHTVTILSPEGGTLTARQGNLLLRNGSYTLPHGTALTLEQTAATGYIFEEYTATEASSLSGNTVVVTGPLTLGATFGKQTCKVKVIRPDATSGTLSVLNNNVSVDVDEVAVSYGTVLTLSNTPATGMEFLAYAVNPASALNGNQVMVRGDVSIGISFRKKQEGTIDPTEPDKKTYPVTFPQTVSVRTPDGAISSGTKVKEGTALTIVISNSRTEILSALAVNGTGISFTTSGEVNIGTHTVSAATMIQPGFRKNSYPVTLVPTEGGSYQVMSPSGIVVNGQEVASGTLLTVKATAAAGYMKERILANSIDISLSGQVTVTEPVTFNVFFKKDIAINPEPDPENPDPSRPVGIDLSVQQLVYNREVQTFQVHTAPGGIIKDVKVTYSQAGKSATPRETGIYDVALKRPADEVFGALDVTIPGGLEILQAPVSIRKVNITEDQLIGSEPSTDARIESGAAVYLEKEVTGTFLWKDNQQASLTVKNSGYQKVLFKPTDDTNFKEAETLVYVTVENGVAQPSYKILWTVEGKGRVDLFNGSMAVATDGLFHAGAVLAIEAIAEDGYAFARFEVDGLSYSDNPCNLTMNADKEVKVLFTPKQDPVTALDVKISPPTNLVYNGQAKLITVSSKTTLTGWVVEYTDADGRLVVPCEAGTYRATVTRAEDKHWLPVRKELIFAVTKATPKVTFPTAQSVSVGSYLLDSRLIGGLASVEELGGIAGLFRWESGNEQLNSDGKIKKVVRFTPSDIKNIFSLTGEVEVEVTASGITPVPVIITYEVSSGGTLAVTKTDGTTINSGNEITAGEEIVITTTGARGYTLSRLTIGGVDYTDQAKTGGGVVSMQVSTSKHIRAEFVRDGSSVNPDPYPDPTPVPTYYTIWVTSSGNGNVSPGTTQVSVGGKQTFTFMAKDNYGIVDVRVDGKSMGRISSYTFSNVQKDATLQVLFSTTPGPVGKSYALTARVEDSGGIVSPSLALVAEGGKQTFFIIPNEGRKVTDVSIGSSEKDLKSVGRPLLYTFTDVHSDSLLVVNFDRATANEVVDVSGLRAYVSGNILHLETDRPMDVRVYDMKGLLRRIRKVSGYAEIAGLDKGVYLAVFGTDTNRKVVKVWIR